LTVLAVQCPELNTDSVRRETASQLGRTQCFARPASLPVVTLSWAHIDRRRHLTVRRHWCRTLSVATPTPASLPPSIQVLAPHFVPGAAKWLAVPSPDLVFCFLPLHVSMCCIACLLAIVAFADTLAFANVLPLQCVAVAEEEFGLESISTCKFVHRCSLVKQNAHTTEFEDLPTTVRSKWSRCYRPCIFVAWEWRRRRLITCLRVCQDFLCQCLPHQPHGIVNALCRLASSLLALVRCLICTDLAPPAGKRRASWSTWSRCGDGHHHGTR
jgi:hypothetical protein